MKKSSNKLVDVLAKNLSVTLVLVLAIVFFVWSCQGRLLSGLITAGAAIIAYMSASMLYRAYKDPSKSKK